LHTMARIWTHRTLSNLLSKGRTKPLKKSSSSEAADAAAKGGLFR